MRADKRRNDELRPMTFDIGYLKHQEGSVMVSAGDTKVLCVVTSEPRVPHHRYESGGGWLSAEYNMLPGSTNQRKARATSTLKNDGRTVEISRLIGRSLRQAVNLDAIGQRTLMVDCDVIAADAGTRCASICGAYVALCAHVALLLKTSKIKMATMEDIILRPIAAVSLGVLKNDVLLDLTYLEDVKADADCNLVGSHNGELVEMQCTAEQAPMSKENLMQIYDMGQAAIKNILDMQARELMKQCGVMFHR